MRYACPLEEGAREAAPAAAAHVGTFECGLCGYAFEVGGRVCGRCPLNAGCNLVKCPRCGFCFPARSRTVDWFRRIARRFGGD